MAVPLRVLIVKDSESDAELVLRQLRRGGFEPQWECVQTAGAMAAALERDACHLVVCDYSMPGFDAPTALRVLKDSGHDLPFVVVSGSIGEDAAVAMMRAGAHDYILKQDLRRFVPAVQRELREAERRRQQRALELEAERSESALANSEARFRGIMQSDMIGLLFWDSAGAIAEANDAFLNIVGYTQDDVRHGRLRWNEMTPPEFAAADRRGLQEIADKGTCTPFEKEYFRKDGSRVPVVIGATAFEHAPGHGVAFVLDRTKSAQSEAGLRVQSAALNAAADGVVITDSRGTIEWVNQAFTTMTGYSREEAIGKNPRDLVRSGVHDDAFYQKLWDTLLTSDTWHGEMTNRRKDGSKYTIDQSMTSVRDANGEVTHFIGIERDLTEPMRLQAQFLQSQKMEVVGRLASGVAHDFNNLLTVINGTAEMSLGDLDEGDPRRADFMQIHAAGNRAAALTRQLLAFSRQQILKPDVLNLASLIGDLQGMLRRLIGEDVALEVSAAADVGNVLADPGQIEQVVMNLAVNARDAMRAGGTLTITTMNVDLDQAFANNHPSVRPGPHVALAISDTGDGIDEATRLHIFEPFFTTKERGKGTGLGLSTVYGIVKQSGGSIWVASEVGDGTTFTIYLPQVAQALGAAAPALPSPQLHGTETILVVEDEDGVRLLTTLILQAAGYTVLPAANGDEALYAADRHEGVIDLLLTDMVMPGMTVKDLAAQFDEARPGTKILFMSGYTENTDLPGKLAGQTSAFIGKPFGALGLRRKVREVLDGSASATGPEFR